MTRIEKFLLVISCLLALAACGRTDPKAYANRGEPENLLTKSTDVVTIDIGPENWNYKLHDTILADPPESAKLNCSLDYVECIQAKNILNKLGVPFEITGAGQSVTMFYTRVLARDCTSRYVNNTSNQRNLNHPTFGCSVVGNTVQMVSDKRQFTNPPLMDFPAAK